MEPTEKSESPKKEAEILMDAPPFAKMDGEKEENKEKEHSSDDEKADSSDKESEEYDEEGDEVSEEEDKDYHPTEVDSMENKTYCLKRVLAIMERNKGDRKMKITNNARLVMFYDSGCNVDFLDTDYVLSVQTDPRVSGPAFCETALISKKEGKIFYSKEFGYTDVIRHADEAAFEAHFLKFCSLLDEHGTTKKEDKEKGKEKEKEDEPSEAGKSKKE
jgi:hypothetical protein